MAAQGAVLDRAITKWRFWLLCAVQIWLTHGIAFLAHEYAHSFTAWLLGFKADPWLLHFGHASFLNVLILLQVNENVDYASIYAQGHGHLAALIGFAGFGIGNVLLYVLCRWILGWSRLSLTPLWRLFFFWLCLMCVGNFYDYVPIRTVDPIGDIYHIVRGLGCPAWAVLIVLGIPIAWAMWQLFFRLFQRTMALSFPGQSHRRSVLRLVSICLVFDFYGGVGLLTDSLVAKALAGASILFSWLCIAYLIHRRRL